MIYDLAHQIVDGDGEPAKDADGNLVPLKKVLSQAVLADTAHNAESKLERFELWLKIRSANLKLELTTEEALLLKEASSVYPTLVHGQLVRWIEGKL